jgi:hypothetical protein
MSTTTAAGSAPDAGPGPLAAPRLADLGWAAARSPAELARGLGVPYDDARRHLRRLVAAGLAEPHRAPVRPAPGAGQVIPLRRPSAAAAQVAAPAAAPMTAAPLAAAHSGHGAAHGALPGVTRDAARGSHPGPFDPEDDAAEAWEDFRYRLGALLLHLHGQRRS